MIVRRRAQLWLGTRVAITAWAPRADVVEHALSAAFAAVAAVHRTMHPRAAGSDLARLNEDGHRRTLRVIPGLWTLLARAKTLHARSDGLFDPAAGEQGGTLHALRLLAASRVRLRRRLAIDLGGIAKGYAVDRAVAALRRAGACAGTVDAGGDVRVFGERPHTVAIRDTQLPHQPALLIHLADGAVATSADYFRGANAHDRGLVDPRTQRRVAISTSVSVVAPTCWAADALTKVVALGGVSQTAALLRRYGARVVAA